jgi:hypothetical protein
MSVEFVQLPSWENYFLECEERCLEALCSPWTAAARERYYPGCEMVSELEGRVTAALWRVVDRLVEINAFARLKRAAPFRIGFILGQDAKFITLRILDWPSFGIEAPTSIPDRQRD